ncbi:MULTISPECIES: condensation domain-containing protein [unclassified Streptomyces]|uniref:condensation domain-containing protein n=2 Tax=Streptomyces TaxID=1883 RepID=UPI0035E0E9D9
MTMAAPQAVTVVIAPGRPSSLELHGPLAPAALEPLLDRFPPPRPALRRHSPVHHTLRLPLSFDAGRLADLLTGPETAPRAAPEEHGEGARDGVREGIRDGVRDGLPGPESVESAESAGSVESAESNESVESAGSVEPLASVEPVESVTSVEPVDSVDSAEPAEALASVDSVPRGPAAFVAARRPYPLSHGHPAAPRQQDILLGSLTHPGAGFHVEQVHWHWYGPLDPERFRAAWQRVTEQEAVLRAVLARPAPHHPPRVVVRPSAVPQIARRSQGAAEWNTLVAAERLREFDLMRGGPLRIVLVDEVRDAGPPGTRILATYHQALIDTRSMGLLLRSFYRAYLDDGRARGGERRPDVRDHLRWVQGQDLGPARAFWSRAAPPAGAATLPARVTGDVAGRRGHGRAWQRLTPHETVRLRDWAAGHGATESTVVQAAWALLLHRAHRARPAPAPVAFAAAVSGRGIALDGAEGMPGALANPLPVAVDVGPRTRIRDLLAALTDQALDTTAYEWVSAGQIHGWSGRAADDELTESVVVFQPPDLLAARSGPLCGPLSDPAAELREDLAAEGVRVEPPELFGAHTGVPMTLAARHDGVGGLALTVVHDRARVADADASECLAQLLRLLRDLPLAVEGSTPVEEVLGLLEGRPVPRMAHRPPSSLRLLRPGAGPGAGVICLIPPPGSPENCYDVLARDHRGPQTLATVTAPADATACLTALGPALAAREPVLLGGYSGAGALAYGVAQRIAAHGWAPPLVAIGGAPGAAPDAARDLAAVLAATAAHAAAGGAGGAEGLV